MRMFIKLVALAGLACAIAAADEPRPVSPAPREKDFLADPSVFPVAVWLQNPARAPDYKAIGINLYVGLWKGPTEAQLAELKKHGMHVICSQNEVGLKHLDDPTVVAWMHGDEPDNAQSLGRGKGYGPPVTPAKVAADYERLKKADPSRPVLLNLGQGVAWDRYVGRGTRTNHPEDYPEYLKGCDIASFDIYPAVHDHRDVAGKLWFVADGVSRLRKWTGGKKPVWNCVECTHISNPKAKATPAQVKAEVWMSLVRGSRGLIYFAHQFQPKFIEAGLLDDKEMAAAVGAINKQIHELAPVLNRPKVADGVRVSSAPGVPVEAIVKRRDGTTYVFAVGMRAGAATATFTVGGLAGKAKAEVLGEGRTVEVRDGVFKDDFAPWDVHLYAVRGE
jgi:hypothetical protein